MDSAWLLKHKEQKMKKLIPVIAIIIIACFSIGTWQPTLAGTWRDDFEDKDTREWKIF